MISQAVQDAIKNAVETGDFRSLRGCLADDVELRIALAAGSAVAEEAGMRSAVDCLQKLAQAESLADDEGPEIVANGERIVAFWDENVSLRSGVAIRGQSTLVFDVHDGLITRLAIHHDLSLAPASMPGRRVGPDAPAAGSAVKHAQRNHAVRARAA